MISRSEEIKDLVSALCIVQSKLEPAKKDSRNPFFNSTYADLTSVWESCRKLLSENGLAIIQSVDTKDFVLSVVTILAHKSGQWISGNISSSIEKMTPQQVGSMISYYRRYGLASIVGVTTEDDDGESTKKEVVRENKPEPKKEVQASKPKINPDIEKLGQTKFTAGIYVGKSFEEVFKLELSSEHKWSQTRIKELKEGKNVPEIAVKYLDYAQSLGVRLV